MQRVQGFVARIRRYWLSPVKRGVNPRRAFPELQRFGPEGPHRWEMAGFNLLGFAAPSALWMLGWWAVNLLLLHAAFTMTSMSVLLSESLVNWPGVWHGLFLADAAVGLFLGPVFAPVLARRLSRRFLRRRLRTRGIRICVACGYDMTATTSSRCAECGATLDPRWAAR